MNEIQIQEQACRLDRRFWLENYFTIKPKYGDPKTLSDLGGLKKAQRMLESLRHHCHQVWKLPFRGLVLKSRKVGISTLEQANAYAEVKEHGHEAIVIAHDLKTAEYLFRILKRYHKHDPLRAPNLQTSTTRELRFEGREGSIEVMTANNADSARGRTPQIIHGSEVSRWDKAAEVAPALFSSVPKIAGTSVTLETTAHGEDPLFYPMWKNAVKHCRLEFTEDEKAPFGFRVEYEVKGDEYQWNRYFPLFISALIDEDCHEPFSSPQQKSGLMASLDEEERWLVGLGATPEFLHWRRITIASPECQGDIRIFHQEYPVTSNQAFVLSGQGRFDQSILDRMPIEEGRRGYLKRVDRWEGGLVFIEEPFEDFVVFSRPKEGHRYLAAADSAQGLQKEGHNDPDASVIHVLDMDSYGKVEQVACFYGQVGEEALIEPIIHIAEWYNFSFIVIEQVGGHGSHLFQEVIKRYPIERVYQESRRQSGLTVHAGNRNRFIANLAKLLHDDGLVIRCQKTVDELKHFKLSSAGRYEAARGWHDDHVMALCGGVVGIMHYPEHLGPISQHHASLRRRRGLFAWQEGQEVSNPDPDGFY